MLKRIQASAEFVRHLIRLTRMPRNQIAAASGLTNTYIRDLEQGNIANVSRQKLIQFAVGINLNLNRIDELLTVFDRAHLSPDDIPLFIACSGYRKPSGALNPLRDFYAYELVVHAVERIPGHQVMVNDRPTVCLRAEGHRTHTDHRLVMAHPIYAELVETIGQVRRATLEANLARYRVEHYICKACLVDYVYGCGDPEEIVWRKRHVQQLMIFMDRFPNLIVHLTSVCSNLLFTFKEAEKSGQTVLNFCARPGHFVPGERPGRLSGFDTTNPVLVQTFQEELGSIGQYVIPTYENRSVLQQFLADLITQRLPGH